MLTPCEWHARPNAASKGRQVGLASWHRGKGKCQGKILSAGCARMKGSQSTPKIFLAKQSSETRAASRFCVAESELCSVSCAMGCCWAVGMVREGAGASRRGCNFSWRRLRSRVMMIDEAKTFNFVKEASKMTWSAMTKFSQVSLWFGG